MTVAAKYSDNFGIIFTLIQSDLMQKSLTKSPPNIFPNEMGFIIKISLQLYML